ncbi:polyisoprenoid-binding protein YceI [Hymenobacter luteus]|uniref:Polyisoprenoid-binding protein YceI n=2 Tax=Hymenobacter TaxID=89966 RepID=A0A7W9SXM9_9BACT|nr:MULTISPECIES: YceI family protein [Hymenobacter]MBB4599883.1 polyisoprenoid-binding protein YceI [Hymenobacter latericoloratus]MBB6057807.1 polyisoprenoid-binding protein YceI [Hymenobacter luteus]
MATTTWVIDPTHSEVQFKIKHLVISTVTGSFKKFEGQAVTENDSFENARITFALDVNSIDTNQEQRDEHLRNNDFFDAATYPQITFTSTSLTAKGDDEYKLTGNMTIKDVTKPVTLDVEFGGVATDFYGNEKAGFEISGKINRKEFGLTFHAVTEAGSIVLGDDVKLSASVQLVKQKEAVAA